MKFRLLFLLLCALPTCLVTPCVADTLSSADKSYSGNQFAEAYKGYNEAIKANQVPPNREKEVEYRSADCLMHLQPGQTALKTILALVKKYPHTVWEARYLTLLGRTYWTVPHTGVKRGDRFFRGLQDEEKDANANQDWNNIDWGSKNKATKIDATMAYNALEAARVRYCALPNRAGLEREEILLDRDMLYLFEKNAFLLEGDDPDEKATIDTRVAYNTKWGSTHKHLYLFEQIKALCKNNPTLRSYRASAYYDEAKWLSSYHDQQRENTYNGSIVKYPYQDWKPIPILEECLRTTPSCPETDLVHLLIADFYFQEQKIDKATQHIRIVTRAQYPNLEILRTAQRLQKAINDPMLDWARPEHTRSVWGDDSGVVITNTPYSLTVRSRNAPRLQCALYRVPMEAVVKVSNPDNPIRRGENTAEILQEYKEKPEVGLKTIGALLQRRWEVSVASHNLQTLTNTKIDLPTQEGGYFVLLASCGKTVIHKQVHISKHSLVVAQNGNKFTAYALDAKSGKPLANQTVYVWGYLPEGSVKTRKVTTDAEGKCFWTVDTHYSSTCWILSKNDIAYQTFSDSRGSRTNSIKLFGVTDRRVYRPGQTVYYRLVATQEKVNVCKPIPHKPVTIIVRNSDQQVIAQTSAVANEFGSVQGKIPLSAKAALGTYYFYLKEVDRGETVQNLNFRVEEYKKPEFEVTVTAETGTVALGQKGKFKIKASYYFGGGVPNAKITYQLSPQNYYDMYRWYDFRRTRRRDEGGIGQGVLYTNAQGEAFLPIDTTVLQKAIRSDVLAFRASLLLAVQVQDASRRVIEGSGTMNVDKGEGTISTSLSENYGKVASPLEITLNASDYDDKPLGVTGQVVIQRVKGEGKQNTIVYQERVEIPTQGKTTVHWTPTQGGLYEVSFRASGKRLFNSYPHNFHVVGKGLLESDLVDHIRLEAQKPRYNSERSAHILLTTPAKESWVLLRQENSDGTDTTQVLHLRERVKELEIPLSANYSDSRLEALTIRDGVVFHDDTRIGRAEHRLKAVVKMEADKAVYQPGERAHFKVHVRDYQGKPLHTELSLAVTDASLEYFTRQDGNDWSDFAFNSYEYTRFDTPRQWESFNYGTDDRYWFSFHERPDRTWQSTLEWLEQGYGRIVGEEWSNDKRRPLYGHRREGAVYDGRRGFGGGMGGAMMGGGVLIDGLTAGLPATRDDGNSDGEQRNLIMGRRYTTPYEAQLMQRERLVNAQLRNRFADTAVWIPSLITDAEGNAEATVTMPENLTRWQAKTAGNTVDGLAGVATADVTTRKELLGRLQTPRFLLEKDTVILSAIVQNSYDHSLPAQVRLEMQGGSPQLVSNLQKGTASDLVAEIVVPAKGEKRVDWAVRVSSPGELKLHIAALTSTESDATEATLPVLVHGVEKAQTKSGYLRGKSQVNIPLSFSGRRKPGSSRVVIHLAPSLVGVMLDTLPYLADYPYGCVEQTMSRFLPSVVVSKTLKDLGYNLGDLQKRSEALALQAQKSPDTLNTTDNSPYTYPQATLTHLPPITRQHRWDNPVFQEARLNDMIQAGWKRLKQMENRNGGWGWWSNETPDPYMTTYVLYGLKLAKSAGVSVPQEMLRSGSTYLNRRISEEKDLNLAAYQARVLTLDAKADDAVSKRILEVLYPSRDKMSLYGRALLALALQQLPQPEKAKTVLAEIESLLQAEAKHGRLIPQTTEYWYWHNNETETLATILQAYVAIQPKAELAPRIVQELIRTRQNHIWESTRDTALVVMAMADYVHTNHELQSTYTVQIAMNGKTAKTYTVIHENALLEEGQIALGEEFLVSGTQTLTLTKNGEGNCYYTVEARHFSEEETLHAVRGEVQVERRYYRVKPNPAYQPLKEEESNPLITPSLPSLVLQDDWSLRTEAIQLPTIRTVLVDGTQLESGDMLEVELYLNSNNPQAYMLFEDIKPAGCEAVQLQSGMQWSALDEERYSFWGRWFSYYQELRDQKVAFMLESLPQGKTVIKYQLRAETPGVFRILPTNAYAMYAPSIRALSEEGQAHIVE